MFGAVMASAGGVDSHGVCMSLFANRLLVRVIHEYNICFVEIAIRLARQ